jgi:hypothetical protein
MITNIRQDIERCENAQSTAEGSRKLYEELLDRYIAVDEDFEKNIPGFAPIVNGASDWRKQLALAKVKLETMINKDKSEETKDKSFNMFLAEISEMLESNEENEAKFKKIQKLLAWIYNLEPNDGVRVFKKLFNR